MFKPYVQNLKPYVQTNSAPLSLYLAKWDKPIRDKHIRKTKINTHRLHNLYDIAVLLPIRSIALGKYGNPKQYPSHHIGSSRIGRCPNPCSPLGTGIYSCLKNEINLNSYGFIIINKIFLTDRLLIKYLKEMQIHVSIRPRLH